MLRTAVIIGKFQVPDLHNAHHELIKHALWSADQVIVFVGVSVKSKSNPLNFHMREAVIKAKFPSVTILPLSDMPLDKDWTNCINRQIKTIAVGEVTIFYGRDSFKPHYLGGYKLKEYLQPHHESVSGRKCRENILPVNKREFLEGVIYNEQNRCDRVYPTVDIACHSKGMVILGKKPNSPYLRFPGGFVDPGDASLEEAARREFKEECGLALGGNFRYLASFRQDDWRYRSSSDRITTTLFEYKGNTEHIPTAGDDLVEVAWYQVYGVDKHIDPVHVKLYEKFISEVYN